MPYSVQINTPKSYAMIYKDSNGIEHFYWIPSYQAFKDAIIDIQKYGADLRRLWTKV